MNSELNLNEKCYQEIAQELNSMIPVKWQQIKLRAEIGEDSIGSYFMFAPFRGEFI